MAKRGKLEIIKDIIEIIKFNHNSVKHTPLLRKSNLSSTRFKEYYTELLEKGFITEKINKRNRLISLTTKGERFHEKYKTMINFIEEFDL